MKNRIKEYIKKNNNYKQSILKNTKFTALEIIMGKIKNPFPGIWEIFVLFHFCSIRSTVWFSDCTS